MDRTTRTRLVLLASLLTFSATGCVDDSAPPDAKPDAPKASAEAKKVDVGKNVQFEVNGDQRRVLINAYVCLRQGPLEVFLTRKNTKEHEAVLAADVDARKIHAALMLARATPGSPVKFRPEFKPASGSPIKVTIEFKDDKGRLHRAPAQSWIRNFNTKKDMHSDWVFGGSILMPDPFDPTKQPFYAANDGDVISLSNFETAMLDLPVSSPQGNDDLMFEAHTERIPPMSTPVTVILEPFVKMKK